jgi:hypothetical protein
LHFFVSSFKQNKAMPKIFLFVTVLFLSAGLFAQNLVLQDSVHGLRYCEIIVVTGNLPKLKATVYNTIGCNNCPADQWKKLEAAKLRKQFDAKAVIMSGPRYLVMDKLGLSDTVLPNTRFDSLEMKERAVVIVTLGMAMKGRSKPYEEQGFHRATQCVFNKGSEVYELISPVHTYIMQSYSQMVDTTMADSSLSHLQEKLKLPEGWEFKTLRLEDDLILTTTETAEAYVTQDELQNTYQRIK